MRPNLSGQAVSATTILYENVREQRQNRAQHDRAKTRPANDLDDLYFTTRRIAMCIGLGFGWLHLTRGNLRRAENALITARAFLTKPDPIVSSFIELLYGTIRRCRAGQDQEEAIDSLEQARTAFEHKHPRYHAYTCLELALSYTLTGKYDQALRYLGVAEEYAQQNESRWLINIHIRRSRIRSQQHDYERALEEAEKAIKLAESTEAILPRADAYIVRGQVRFYFAQEYARPSTPAYVEARKDFETALELVTQRENSHPGSEKTLNPKIASVCELGIAQCYAGEGNQIKAKSHFERWYIWEPIVEHQWVRDLAKQAEADISKLDDFFSISSKNPDEWNYNRQFFRLREWLYAQAMRETNNDQKKAAELLGVARSTVFSWRFGVTHGRAKRTR